MPADNKTLLEIVNNISQELTGRDAATSGNRPTKAEITKKVNNEILDICAGKNWYFLYARTAVDGFTASINTDTVATVSGTPTAGSLQLNNVTTSLTEDFTTAETYHLKPISATLSLGAAISYVGLINSSITLTIHADNNGAPGATALYTSDAITITDNVTSTGITLPVSALTDVTFTFSNVATVLNPATKYWFKLTATPAIGNGRALIWGDVSGVAYASLSWYQASLNTELTIPANYENVFRIYSGSATAPTVDLFQYAQDDFMRNPSDVPSNTFVLRTMTNGQIIAYINPSATSLLWNVEGKTFPTALSADSDTPVIPRNYRELIEWGVILHYAALGIGTQDKDYIGLIKAKYDERLKSMRRNFLIAPKTHMVVKRGGGVGTWGYGASPEPNRNRVNDGINRPSTEGVDND